MFSSPLDLQAQAYLTTLYGQSHRYYHNIQHVNDCLAEFYKSEPKADMVHAVTWGIWFHDAVYNPYAPAGQNEYDSAKLFRLHGWADSRELQEVEMVAFAIRATAHHTDSRIWCSDHISAWGLDITQLLLDIDLAGFGSPLSVYSRNSLNIRKEYYRTTDTDFIAGRLKFLQAINRRETLYYTEYFRDAYHTQSKSNIEFEIEVLADSVDRDPTRYFDWLHCNTEGLEYYG